MPPDTLSHERSSPAGAQTLSVLFFGEVADRLGRTLQVAIPVGGCRLSALRRSIAALGPEAADALAKPGLRAAVAQDLAVGDPWVAPGQEVAFFSAFSGG